MKRQCGGTKGIVKRAEEGLSRWFKDGEGHIEKDMGCPRNDWRERVKEALSCRTLNIQQAYESMLDRHKWK